MKLSSRASTTCAVTVDTIQQLTVVAVLLTSHPTTLDWRCSSNLHHIRPTLDYIYSEKNAEALQTLYQHYNTT